MRTLLKIKILTPLLLPALLAGCGGGGNEACSSERLLSIRTTWNSNGNLGPDVRGQVGRALTARPSVEGIPASCAGQERFSWSSTQRMPDGLALDGRSGVISGTPTRAGRVGAVGTFVGLVELELPGYGGVKVLEVIDIAP